MTASEHPWWTPTTNTPHPTTRPPRRPIVPRWLLITTIVAAAAYIALPSGPAPTQGMTPNGVAMTYQSASAFQGICGPTYTHPANNAADTIVDDTTADKYHALTGLPIPVQGPLVEPGTIRRFCAPNATDVPTRGQLAHLLHSGATIAYYTREVPDTVVDFLRRMSLEETHLNLYVVPQRHPAATPPGRTLGWATWRNIQTCNTFVPQALRDFVEQPTHDPARPAIRADRDTEEAIAAAIDNCLPNLPCRIAVMQ